MVRSCDVGGGVPLSPPPRRVRERLERRPTALRHSLMSGGLRCRRHGLRTNDQVIASMIGRGSMDAEAVGRSSLERRGAHRAEFCASRANSTGPTSQRSSCPANSSEVDRSKSCAFTRAIACGGCWRRRRVRSGGPLDGARSCSQSTWTALGVDQECGQNGRRSLSNPVELVAGLVSSERLWEPEPWSR
jgi:hypothetical protein